MSYSVAQKPAKYTPAYNPVIYVCESSNAGAANMRYIAQIYTAALGSTVALLATVKQYPLADGNCVFDLHRILESQVSYDITIDGTSSAAFIQNQNSFAGYIVKFGEEYGATGSVVQHLALSTDTQKFVFNASFELPDFANYAQASWLIAAGTQKNLLTNQPLVRRIRLGTKDWLHCMQDTDIIDHALVTVVDLSGASTTHNIVNTYAGSGLAADSDRFLRFTAGPANLTTWITATTAYYTIVLQDASNNPISETVTFMMTDTLPKYPYYRLHFLNKLGGFDSFDFGKVSHLKTDNITRQSYQRVVGSESGGAWAYTNQDLIITPFDVKTKGLVSIESDWITDAESVWLQELVLSPLVFFESNSSSLIPVNIETTSYERRQKANEKVINIKLDISYGYTITSQRQ